MQNLLESLGHSHRAGDVGALAATGTLGSTLAEHGPELLGVLVLDAPCAVLVLLVDGHHAALGGAIAPEVDGGSGELGLASTVGSGLGGEVHASDVVAHGADAAVLVTDNQVHELVVSQVEGLASLDVPGADVAGLNAGLLVLGAVDDRDINVLIGDQGHAHRSEAVDGGSALGHTVGLAALEAQQVDEVQSARLATQTGALLIGHGGDDGSTSLHEVGLAALSGSGLGGGSSGGGLGVLRQHRCFLLKIIDNQCFTPFIIHG